MKYLTIYVKHLLLETNQNLSKKKFYHKKKINTNISSISNNAKTFKNKLKENFNLKILTCKCNIPLFFGTPQFILFFIFFFLNIAMHN